METGHKFGIYHPANVAHSYIMDDFGNAHDLTTDEFIQAIEFIVSGYGTDH